jgi:type II secretory pathway pseudopilin PulG
MKLSYRTPANKTWAFTLTELLMVMGIIALLSSVLVPAIAKSKAVAQSIQCVNNQRQINLALQMFADEHDGYLPGSDSNLGRGVGQITPFSGQPASYPESTLVRLKYVHNKRIFACPQILTSKEIERQMLEIFGWPMAYHYRFNVDFVGTKLSQADLDLPAFRNPTQPGNDDPNRNPRRLIDGSLESSKTVLAGDCVGATDVTSNIGSLDRTVPGMIFLSAMHSQNRSTVANYADGHVGSIRVPNPSSGFFQIGGVPTY